jgi:hypothetical protein
MINQVIFFRYRGKTLAINHVSGKDEHPILLCEECVQYPRYRELMNAAIDALKNSQDGKWIYDFENGWTHHPIQFDEALWCQIALNQEPA